MHAKGAQRIARIAAQAGVSRFVHISHLNASHNSKSKFYRSKAEGEELVKEAFPNATIVRPPAMYGLEDKFLTNMACTSPKFTFVVFADSGFQTGRRGGR